MEIPSLVMSVLALLVSGYAVRVARKDRTADVTLDAEERRLRAVRLAQSVGREIAVAQETYERWRRMGYRMKAEQQLELLATMEQARKNALTELEAMEVDGADRTELARLESSVITSLEHVQKMNEIIFQTDEKLEASRGS